MLQKQRLKQENKENNRKHNVKQCPETVCFRGHWETKGRFCKRVVLANVPSLRLSFRGNKRRYPHSGFRSGGTSECTLVPVCVPGEHPPKPPFWKTTLLSTLGGCGKRWISQKRFIIYKNTAKRCVLMRGSKPRMFVTPACFAYFGILVI